MAEVASVERKHLLPHIRRQWKRCRPGVPMNMDNPRTFAERVQWLKVYDDDRGQRDWCDKLLARDRVADARLGHILVPLTDSAPCAVKVNHWSGGVVFAADEDERSGAYYKLRPMLNKIYGITKGEWGYDRIAARIYSEQIIEQNADYKFHCVNGEVRLIQLITNRQSGARETLYDTGLNRIDLHFSNSAGRGNDLLPHGGDEIAEMLPIAQQLSAGWRYVRVDLYWSNRVYFGELTFWPMSGFCRAEADAMLGEIIAW